MGKDYKEREAYKYLHDMVDSVSIAVRKGWNRRNFDVGRYRKKRIEISEAIINNETQNEINSSEV